MLPNSRLFLFNSLVFCCVLSTFVASLGEDNGNTLTADTITESNEEVYLIDRIVEESTNRAEPATPIQPNKKPKPAVQKHSINPVIIKKTGSTNQRIKSTVPRKQASNAIKSITKTRIPARKTQLVSTNKVTKKVGQGVTSLKLGDVTGGNGGHGGGNGGHGGGNGGHGGGIGGHGGNGGLNIDDLDIGGGGQGHGGVDLGEVDIGGGGHGHGGGGHGHGGGGKRRKCKKDDDEPGFMEKMLPMMVAPFMISSTMMPMMMISMIVMMKKSAIMGLIGFVLMIVNMFTNKRNPGAVSSHNIDMRHPSNQIAMAHYGWHGDEEYGAYVNKRRK